MDSETNEKQAPASPIEQTTGPMEQDAIYQGNRLVARVLDAKVDLEAKEIRIGEVFNSDELMIPDECEFQRYRILIQRIAYATKVDKAEPHKGRILRGVTADILGYREQ
jgi:hypothetical protein